MEKDRNDDWMNEPLMGYPEDQLGVLGLPLPKQPDLFETVLALLSAGPKFVPETRQMARAVAAQGRGGGTEIAHLTPGEMVIPKRLQTAEVLAAIKRAAGGPIERYTVGNRANRVNPRTGAPEFDDVGEDASDSPADLSPDDGYAPVADDRSQLQTSSDLPTFPKLHAYVPEAAAVYGETASLRPQLIDPTKSAEDPSNWQPDSAARLANGRADIAGLYARNTDMRKAQPTNFLNPIQLREWNSALQAAARAPEAEQGLDPRIHSFYMRQEGKPLPGAPAYTIIGDPIGPFRKRGAGQVPGGNATYLDFYDRQQKK